MSLSGRRGVFAAACSVLCVAAACAILYRVPPVPQVQPRTESTATVKVWSRDGEIRAFGYVVYLNEHGEQQVVQPVGRPHDLWTLNLKWEWKAAVPDGDAR